MQDMEDLNDLRIVAMIGRSGSLAGAARLVGVNHATVFRRLNQLESKIGVRLFERDGGRYRATTAGIALIEAGAKIAQTANDALLKVAGQDLRLQGLVRLTTTDSFALSILPPLLARCREHFPLISLQLEVDNHAADLSKRDADIAIRPTLKPPEHLIGKRVGDLPFAVYGSKPYVQKLRRKPLAQAQWIALDDRYFGHRTLRWLEALVDINQIALRASSFGVAREACLQGMGLCVLPSVLGETDARLKRVGGPIADCAGAAWLLMHPDLRNTTRVKAVFAFLGGELTAALSR